ncbi:MAG: hypothetical protein WAM28_02560 [Chlamydiales bacterium]
MTFQKNNIYALPVLHYTMECAMHVKRAFEAVQPDCVAVELPQSHEEQFLHAASRLPDITVVVADPLYYLCEPCDGAFEALRLALDNQKVAYCIDLDVRDYPPSGDLLPDPYSIVHIGLKKYYAAYLQTIKGKNKQQIDERRELYMARRLKELSLSYDRVLYVGGFYHLHTVLEYVDRSHFPNLFAAKKEEEAYLCALTEDSLREVMIEYGWLSQAYESWRENSGNQDLLDRQKLLLQLYKSAALAYQGETGNAFCGYHLRNMMKFVRNYALLHKRLMPDLFKIVTAAKGCVDPNYAYEVWYLATDYPYHRNIDNLHELNLSVEDIWPHSKKLKFQLKQKRRKGFQRHPRHRRSFYFHPPSAFGICSYPPEDVIIENFGGFLKKKTMNLLIEGGAQSAPFTTRLADGIDIRETIRHLAENKLYVKMKGPPPEAAGSVVVILDGAEEKYSWSSTWLGEHNQESDMAFFATTMTQNVVGPGISRCHYGGFMLSTPPRRLYDIWQDQDYKECSSKAEVLLMAAIDYAVQSTVIYVAAKPPQAKMKQFASRFGKKIVYMPMSQLSPTLLNKIRVFHVLDGHDKREIAGDYVF